MSLPLSGSDAYHLYSTTGLTNKWKLMSAASVDGIWPEACTTGFWPKECGRFAERHRLVRHARDHVSSPSSIKSSLLGLHWSPLGGMTHPDKRDAAKDGGTGKEGTSEEPEGKAEEAAGSSGQKRVYLVDKPGLTQG